MKAVGAEQMDTPEGARAFSGSPLNGGRHGDPGTRDRRAPRVALRGEHRGPRGAWVRGGGVLHRRYGSDVCTRSRLCAHPGRALARRAVSGGAIPDEDRGAAPSGSVALQRNRRRGVEQRVHGPRLDAHRHHGTSWTQRPGEFSRNRSTRATHPSESGPLWTRSPTWMIARPSGTMPWSRSAPSAASASARRSA